MEYRTILNRLGLYVSWYMSIPDKNSTLGVWVKSLIVSLNKQASDYERTVAHCNARCMYGNYQGKP